MKQLRFVALVLAASLACAAIAFACGGSKSTNAAAAASGSSCCAAGAGATAANAKGAKGAKSAAAQCTPEMQAACTPEMKAACSASGAGASCGMHGTSASAAMMDCAVCAEGASCDEDMAATGAHRQVVALKNGAMLVYTADAPEGVRALQASVARHNASVMAVLAGQRSGKLCAHCKPLRGAMASGKLVREVVNVQRGAQIVITSPDRATVERIHEMTGAQVAARVRD